MQQTGRSCGIWLPDYNNRRAWTVFSPEGLLLGRISRPWTDEGGPTELKNIGADHVVIKRFDIDGAAHLSFNPLLAGVLRESRDPVIRERARRAAAINGISAS